MAAPAPTRCLRLQRPTRAAPARLPVSPVALAPARGSPPRGLSAPPPALIQGLDPSASSTAAISPEPGRHLREQRHPQCECATRRGSSRCRPQLRRGPPPRAHFSVVMTYAGRELLRRQRPRGVPRWRRARTGALPRPERDAIAFAALVRQCTVGHDRYAELRTLRVLRHPLTRRPKQTASACARASRTIHA